MSNRYPSIPDPGSTVESVATAVRALKLHAEIAHGATKDTENRFVRYNELPTTVSGGSTVGGLGYGYYLDGQYTVGSPFTFGAGWVQVTNDLATSYEDPPDNVPRMYNSTSNRFVNLEDDAAYVIGFDADVDPQGLGRYMEMRLIDAASTGTPYQDVRTLPKDALTGIHCEVAFASVQELTQRDYEWQIIGSHAGMELSSIQFSIVKVVQK